jgi:hypothetical protein
MSLAMVLVYHQRRTCRALDNLYEEFEGRARTVLDVLELAASQLALEERLVSAGLLGDIDVAMCRRIHARARLALFGLATADPVGPRFHLHLFELRALLAPRAGRRAASLEERRARAFTRQRMLGAAKYGT